MKKLILFSLLIASFFIAKAYRMEAGNNLTITKPVFEDLYLAGGTITINAPVHGDLIVAGGTIYINDTISNDILLAGGTVYINGYVGDDIRCMGGELHIQKNVKGDLVITGGRVDIATNVTIDGSLIAAGGQIVSNGMVNGDIKSASGTFTLNGAANRDLDCRGQQIIINGKVMGNSVLAARQIEIGNDAAFNGKVRYWSKNSISFKQSLKEGNAFYDPSLKMNESNWYFLGNATWLGLFWYLSTVLLFLVVIQYLFSNTFKKAGNTFSNYTLKSLGFGALFFIGVPIATAILLVTIIGIPIGIILILLYISIILLATIITSLVLANWYNIRFQNNWNFWQLVFSSLAMFILLKLISFTPFLGWLIMIAIACIAFGAILRNINWRRKRYQVAV